jgi:hypothetical protein
MFEVRITGLVPENLLHQLAYVEVVAQELTTSLRGHFRDQAELHGFLATVRSLGLDVIEIRRLTGPYNSGDAEAER